MILQFREFYSGYIDPPRHWCPRSQPYAGVDALLGYLEAGWKIQGDIGFDDHWFGEARRIRVYQFILTQQDRRITMHVLQNPVLERLLAHYGENRKAAMVDETDTDAANDPHEQQLRVMQAGS